jgi:vacuolar-type H+-ATPase subunit C/Vma6
MEEISQKDKKKPYSIGVRLPGSYKIKLEAIQDKYDIKDVSTLIRGLIDQLLKQEGLTD